MEVIPQSCDGAGWFRHHADTVGTQVQSRFDTYRHNKIQMYRAKLISWIFVAVVEDMSSNLIICTINMDWYLNW